MNLRQGHAVNDTLSSESQSVSSRNCKELLTLIETMCSSLFLFLLLLRHLAVKENVFLCRLWTFRTMKKLLCNFDN